jgi:uncharacterized protein
MSASSICDASGFEWDEHNLDKNRNKHSVVEPGECEEIFFNEPLIIENDVEHSIDEPRFFALGKTDMERRLFIVFTLRGARIRVISARDMSRKERAIYEKDA